MKKTWCFLLLIAYCLLFFPITAHADYVLPYPAYMPGNKIYTLARIIDRMKNYWYWGSLGQYKYHLGLSDKYLVEAKTLFEYKQYLLGVDALERSNKEFTAVPGSLEKAKAEGKDVRRFITLFKEAGNAHSEVLRKLQSELPAQFTWKPEKGSPSGLRLSDLLSQAISLREGYESKK